jgi:hypothetical protein
MQSKSKTVKEYLLSLPEDRAKVISKIRNAILKNLPKGFEETMQYGMISYVVPHSIYPAGYHTNSKDALPFISLASQKNYISLYHMALYDGNLLDWFKAEWNEITDQKLDMGKGCVRFKRIEDIPVSLIGELCSRVTVSQWIERYERTLKNR